MASALLHSFSTTSETRVGETLIAQFGGKKKKNQKPRKQNKETRKTFHSMGAHTNNTTHLQNPKEFRPGKKQREKKCGPSPQWLASLWPCRVPSSCFHARHAASGRRDVARNNSSKRISGFLWN
jgi:hypothetical protein